MDRWTLTVEMDSGQLFEMDSGQLFEMDSGLWTVV